MVAFTPNYNLGKPSGAIGGDFVDVTVLDANMDIVDTALHNHDLHFTTSDGRLSTLEGNPTVLPAYVRLMKSAAQAIPNSLNTLITWDTEMEDLQGFHAVNSSAIVVPAGLGGLYQINARVYWAASAAGIRQCYLFVNGAGALVEDTMVGSATGLASRNMIHTVLRLNDGDSVAIQGNQSSGGALNAIGTLAAADAYFDMTRLPS